MLRLHDTASGELADIVPRDRGKFTLYVCGPTVDGSPHIGHGRFALVYDVLRRFLSYAGNEVRYVSNITDIDDKIINRANREERSWREVATEYEQEWWTAMGELGVLVPDVVPHATEYIDQMIDLIEALVRDKAAYETGDGVYLSVASVPNYGLLKHQDLDSLLAGARVDVIEEKRSPGDFALWKKAKPGEPSWSSPFGDGRPGWHTECVVMSLALLGEGFDLHGGGQDLIFPHHENERAQAVALGRDFSHHWVHNGLVTVGGEKMSKSLGNFFTLAELVATSDPRAYRLLVLRSYFRSPLEVTPETLADAATALGRVDALSRRVLEAESSGSGLDWEAVRSSELDQERSTLRAAFVAAMENDLDTPKAVGQLFTDLRRANGRFDEGDGVGGAALGRTVLELLGVLGVYAKSEAVSDDAAIVELANRRDEARAARDFSIADSLRQQIESLGYTVEDTPAGTRFYRS